MKTRRFALTACLAFLTLHAPGESRAAESYDSCAGFIDSVPAVLTSQGVWCLRRDLSTAQSSGTVITIGANNVTIDCNGFKLGGLAAGSGTTAVGIYASARHNATVRNCNVRGFYYGILFYGDGSGHLVEDNRLDNNLSSAISVGGENNTVRRNLAYDTGGTNASVWVLSGSADFIDNVVSNASSLAGISVGIQFSGSVQQVRGNRIAGVAGGGSDYGIHAIGAGHVISGNHVAYDPGVVGTGIRTEQPGVFCRDNTVYGYSVAFNSCRDSGGNDPAPP